MTLHRPPSTYRDAIPPPDLYRRYGKRLFDLAISTACLILLSPLILGVTLAVLLFMGPPILFRQERPGLHGKSFRLIKFRTLRTSDKSTSKSSDQQRLTRVGGFLRRTHLDELPQLINVLLGDMSLVGPRPLLVEYLSRYTSEQARRHEILPGITGLAQVRGGNRLPWSERFALDVWYVDHASFKLDRHIILETLVQALRVVHHSDEALFSQEFTGPESE